tara:strand:- start:308 stop:562 length:255 start_codon:yes stop_codon:yes gene_type:complete
MTTLVKSIYLNVVDYGPDKGKLQGSIEFISKHGEIKVRIGNEKAAQIVAILADQLVQTAQETAALMTSQILEQAASQSSQLLEA